MRQPAPTDAEVKANRKVTPVRPMKVELHCFQEGCAGLMEFTGSTFTQIDTTYDHRCSMCGLERGIVNQHFPRIEYLPEI